MNDTRNDHTLSYSIVVFLVFLILKLTDVIDWSWWWVTAPLWGFYALAFALSFARDALLIVGYLLAGVIRGIYIGVCTLLAHPILWWEQGRNKHIAAVYDARKARAASMANHPAGKARDVTGIVRGVNLTK